MAHYPFHTNFDEYARLETEAALYILWTVKTQQWGAGVRRINNITQTMAIIHSKKKQNYDWNSWITYSSKPGNTRVELF